MMKILVIISILLLFLNFYLIWDNQTLKSRIDKQIQENEALTIYLETLHEKIKHYEAERTEGVEVPKTLKIRELLESYLRERNEEQYQPENLISTEELRNDLQDYQLKQRFIPNIVPITGEYVISQKYTDKHKGIDIAAPLGSEVVATAAGVVKSVYEDKYFGNVVVIDHLNHYLTFYAHLAKSFYQIGYFVEKGQTIALVGNSGFSNAPHLHYEVLYRGDNIDPMQLADYQ